jgi:hypothetical protein
MLPYADVEQAKATPKFWGRAVRVWCAVSHSDTCAKASLAVGANIAKTAPATRLLAIDGQCSV